MANAAAKIGFKCKVYVNTATYGSPTWAAVAAVNDWTWNIEANSADANDRCSFTDAMVKTGVKISFTGTVRVGGENAEKFLDEMYTCDVLDVLVLDGTNATNGAKGIRCDVQVHGGTQSQNRGDTLYHQITLMPTPSANPVKAVLVATGAPTYGEITGDAPSFA